MQQKQEYNSELIKTKSKIKQWKQNWASNHQKIVQYMLEYIEIICNLNSNQVLYS